MTIPVSSARKKAEEMAMANPTFCLSLSRRMLFLLVGLSVPANDGDNGACLVQGRKRRADFESEDKRP
jgi:hypothetical protein